MSESEGVDNTMSDDLEVALGREWSSEDSQTILRSVNLILIEGRSDSLNSNESEYRQLLEVQIREYLSEQLGDYKDCLVREVLRLCEESARDKGSFLHVSTTATDRTWSDDEGGEDDDEIHKHLVIRSCDDGNIKIDEEEEDAEICSICLENLYQRGTNTATLKCWHEFHADCIKKWFLGGQSFCPLCKKDATRHVGAR